MTTLLDGMLHEINFTTTLNGAAALKTTNRYLLDFYGILGAMRQWEESEVIKSFEKAFNENPELALKATFYARDIRNGGLGERTIPRTIWRYLAVNHPDVMRKNIIHIPFYGRWDDMWIFVNTPVENEMWDIVRYQFHDDLRDMDREKSISLLAKWMKSFNASSKDSKKLALKTAKELRLSLKDYRKTLSRMRKYIDVTERKMSGNKWHEIDYSNVPSKAMNIYNNAFVQHDLERFNNYLSNVREGKDKINASTLYPYEIIEKYMYSESYINPVFEEQWKSLPNYILDDKTNILIMADVSGSMRGRPMATAISLSMYFAERNHGMFQNYFMTFSRNPKLVEIYGKSVFEKCKNIERSEWNRNTNIEKAFKMVLSVALKSGISKEEMPKSIIIISDLEFDQMVQDSDWLFYDSMEKQFNEAGYDIPNIVFWNVNSLSNVYHVASNRKGVQLASGSSAATFRAVIDNIGCTPYETMLNVLNNPVYDRIKL